jgi:hypothetical protein
MPRRGIVKSNDLPHLEVVIAHVGAHYDVHDGHVHAFACALLVSPI